MTFQVIDYVFSFIIIVFAVIGVIRGFIENILGKLSWILGILGAFFFYERVASYVLYGIKNKIIANILAFIILFIIIFLIIKVLQVLLGKMFDGKILGSLDRTLGFFFGIVEGLAVVTLLIFLLSVQPFFKIDEIATSSWFFGLFQKYIGYGTIALSGGLVSNV